MTAPSKTSLAPTSASSAALPDLPLTGITLVTHLAEQLRTSQPTDQAWQAVFGFAVRALDAQGFTASSLAAASYPTVASFMAGWKSSRCEFAVFDPLAQSWIAVECEMRTEVLPGYGPLNTTTPKLGSEAADPQWQLCLRAGKQSVMLKSCVDTERLIARRTSNWQVTFEADASLLSAAAEFACMVSAERSL